MNDKKHIEQLFFEQMKKLSVRTWQQSFDLQHSDAWLEVGA